ncbi:MAG: laccase domain-containing protein [Collinsella sp.]
MLLCFADCVPVVLVAPGGFAVVHSGWKGTIARISAKACQALCDAAGCDASDVSPISAPISWVTNMRYPRNSWIALPPSSLHRCEYLSHARSFRCHSRGAGRCRCRRG